MYAHVHVCARACGSLMRKGPNIHRNKKYSTTAKNTLEEKIM